MLFDGNGKPVRVAPISGPAATLAERLVRTVRAQKKLDRAKKRVTMEGFSACGALDDEYMYAEEQSEYNDAAWELHQWFLENFSE